MKARLLSVTYEPSNSVEVQGSYEKAERYTKKGYHIVFINWSEQRY